MQSLKKINQLIVKQKLIHLALGLVLIIIAGIGVVSYKANTTVYENSLLRKKAHNDLELLQMMRNRMISLDDSYDKYMRFKSEKNLNSYYENILQLNELINKSLKNFSHQKQLKENSEVLADLISKRIEARNIALMLKNYFYNDSINIKINEYGREIRRILPLLETNHYRLLEDKDEKAISSIQNTTISILTGTVLSCTIFLFVFYLLVKEMNERKKIEAAIRNEMQFTERLINSSIDGIIAFDKNCVFTLWNPGMESMTSIPRNKVIGQKAFSIFPVLEKTGEDKYYYEALQGNFVFAKDRWITFSDPGKEFYYEAYYSPIFDSEKEVIGGLAIIRNTTQRKLASEALEKAKAELEVRVVERTAALSKANDDLKKEIDQRKIAEQRINNSLQEKVILLQEIHHRVKNNLQVISSLLNLQSGYLEDEKSLEVFRESQNRVRSMALIHERLYQSKDLNKIEFGDYIGKLCRDLFASYNIDSERIKLNAQLSGIFFEVDIAILCGLILNELISNSLKHAFPGNRSGEIHVSLCEENDKYILIVKDNGIGFSPDIDFRNTNSLGLQLVNTLIDQLCGTILLNNKNSTEFIISFKSKRVV